LVIFGDATGEWSSAMPASGKHASRLLRSTIPWPPGRSRASAET
jgi:hypothetical protein